MNRLAVLLCMLAASVLARAGEIQFATPEVECLWSGGNMDAPKLDILIMGDGYTLGEIPKFDKDAKALAASIQKTEPYATYNNFYRIFLVRCVSKESGSRDEKDPPKDTCFGSYYGSALCPGNDKANVELARQYAYRVRGLEVGSNIVIVLVNSDKYGGSAQDENRMLISSIPRADLTLIQHEIGHVLGHLGDEYFTKDVARKSDEILSPLNPNLITEVDDPKWQAWLGIEVEWYETDKVGVPARFSGPVDRYPGGWAKELGVWRPTSNACMMKRVEYPRYCPVCREGIIRGLYEHARIDPRWGCADAVGGGYSLWIETIFPEKSAHAAFLIGSDSIDPRFPDSTMTTTRGDATTMSFVLNLSRAEGSQPILAIVWDDPPEIRTEFREIRYYYKVISFEAPASIPK